MKNNLKYLIMLLAAVFTQFMVNNFTIFYVDIFGAVLVIALLLGSYSWLFLICLSLLADLLSHWYLGTHLIGMVLISIMSDKIVNFYRISNPLNKFVIAVFYYLLLFFIIVLIGFITKKVFFSVTSLLFQIFVVLPIVQLIVHALAKKNKSNSLFYE
ncbi:MAG: hypothetical protein PHC75_00450 [Burkholderiales bacterium]|nr:hypothetical protein [Burkholderiales bacterium]